MSWDPVTQKHKGFAFVEYEIPEGAQLALEQMNGAMLGGRNIKVGRPSNMPQAQQVIDEIQEEAKSYNRIYIASIHPDLTEEDIKSVFEAFGPILYCKLAQGTVVHTHKGYGFIEYQSTQSALEAIASMNLFDLGGQLLRVGRAITPPNALQGPAINTASTLPTAAAVAAATVTAKIQAMDSITSTVLGLSNPNPALNRLAPSVIAPIPNVIQPALMQPAVVPQMAAAPVSVITSGVVVPPPMVVTTPALGKPAPIPVPVTTAAAALEAQPGLQNLVGLVGTTGVGNTNGKTESQEELQKKLLDEAEPQTLQQQESLSIKGQSARHLVMQRLMRPRESKVVILRNMVGPEDVDEMLQEEIQEECSKYGSVDRVVIYNEKQSENEDDDAEIIVKIFVEFTAPYGEFNQQFQVNLEFNS